MKKLYNKLRLYLILRKIKQTIQPANEGKKLVYTDSFDNKWYILNNPANLHATRTLTAWSFTKDSEFGMTRDKLKKLLGKINECINANNLADAAKVTGVIEAGLELYAEPEILLNLATCYTFLNKEKPEYKDYEQEQKRSIWTNDNDCKSFFLQFALQYTARFSESQKLNVLQYLDKTKSVRDQINYVITKTLTKLGGKRISS